MQTRPTLLHRIRDHDDGVAWGEFVEIYTPLLYRFCLSRGLQSSDAGDVCQEVMKNVAGAIRGFEYDPDKGTFRSWLYTVTRNEMNRFFRKKARQPLMDGSTIWMEEADQQDRETEDQWEVEYKQRLFAWAVIQVQPEFSKTQWEAFRRTAIGQEDPHTVGEALGLSRAAVYMAKSRVVSRLREKIQSAVGERWEHEASKVR